MWSPGSRGSCPAAVLSSAFDPSFGAASLVPETPVPFTKVVEADKITGFRKRGVNVLTAFILRPLNGSYLARLWTVGLLVLMLAACASGGGRSSTSSDARRYLRLAQLQFERGRATQAIESARKATSLDSDLADAWDFLGLIYLTRSEFATAANCRKPAR